MTLLLLFSLVFVISLCGEIIVIPIEALNLITIKICDKCSSFYFLPSFLISFPFMFICYFSVLSVNLHQPFVIAYTVTCCFLYSLFPGLSALSFPLNPENLISKNHLLGTSSSQYSHSTSSI